MTPQLLYQLGQLAIERYQKGWRVDDFGAFFENCGKVRLRDDRGNLTSDAPEIAAFIATIQNFETERGE